MRVADQHRPRAEQKVDVFVAAHVPDAAGLAARNHHFVGHVAEGARRQHAPRGVHEFAFGFARLAVRHGAWSPKGWEKRRMQGYSPARIELQLSAPRDATPRARVSPWPLR